MNMRAFELEWAAKMMDSMIPPGVEEQIPLSASETGATQVLREMVFYTPALTALGFRATIWFIELLGPMVASRKLMRFSRLDPSSREEVLDAMFKSKIYFIRQLVLLVKMSSCFAWGANPEVRKSLGVMDEPRFVKRNTT
jgi:hypothetical protein